MNSIEPFSLHIPDLRDRQNNVFPAAFLGRMYRPGAADAAQPFHIEINL